MNPNEFFMKKIASTFWGIVIYALLTSVSAKAQVSIISENFNTSLSPGTSFTQYHGGDTTSYANGIVAGVGVGGTGGWQIVLNAASGGTAGYSYLGAEYQNGGVTGNTSANLSDYTLSFDVMSTGGSLNVQLQSWAAAGFVGSQTGTLSTAPSVGFGDDLTLSPTYTHYSLNLGDATIWHNNTGFIPDGGTLQVGFQLNGGGPTPYSDTMDIDNLQLTMTPAPEPSAIALCALGAVGGAFVFLRRKAFES
jgi:hypothetical protein